jgi:hypothetical protein
MVARVDEFRSETINNDYFIKKIQYLIPKTLINIMRKKFRVVIINQSFMIFLCVKKLSRYFLDTFFNVLIYQYLLCQVTRLPTQHKIVTLT